MDPLREPTRHAGRRFRFDELSFTSAAGKTYPAMLFRPCDASCTDMPAALERYRLRVPPEQAHHVLAGARFFLGDSQTMTAEAAVLGVPAFRYSSSGRSTAAWNPSPSPATSPETAAASSPSFTVTVEKAK